MGKTTSKRRLLFKLFSWVMVLLLVPIGIIANLTFSHLRTIKEVSLQEVRSALVSSQVDYLTNYLAQKAEKISAEFSNIQNQVHSLAVLAGAIVNNPADFSYRNGSHYRLDPEGDYLNPVDDGNSSLFVPTRLPTLNALMPALENFNATDLDQPRPTYRHDLDTLIGATETLDLMLGPLLAAEPRVVLGWFIHKTKVTRTYPWRDFTRLPRFPELTAWPFYYLVDPDHDPAGKEVFTPVYNDPLTQNNMISCLSPVMVDGRHQATVGVDITVETLLREISQVHMGEGSSTLLLAQDEIIAASENLPYAKLGLDPDRPAYGQAMTPERLSDAGRALIRPRVKKVGVDFIETAGLRAYIGHAEVEPLGWRLYLLVPEKDFLGPINVKAQAIFAESERIRSNFLHILIFAIFGIVGLVYLVMAHQSRGLRSLLAGIREFGAGNLDHRIQQDGEDEAGDLAAALNTMAKNLQRQKEELKKAHSLVEQGRKLTAVGRLAAGVAHEVNNPLATISTYTQMMLRQSDLPAQTSYNLRKVMVEIERIQGQLRNFLDLSRLQSLVKTRIDPNQLVRDVIEMARHEARAQGVEISMEFEPAQTCLLDPSGLKQILWNLLSNAIACQEGGGEIRIATCFTEADNARFFTLQVEDAGPGIPQDVLPHVFDPFFTTKEVGKGTGLGLAVVSSIVEGHGGRVEVQNLYPRGCRFLMIFPDGEKA